MWWSRHQKSALKITLRWVLFSVFARDSVMIDVLFFTSFLLKTLLVTKSCIIIFKKLTDEAIGFSSVVWILSERLSFYKNIILSELALTAEMFSLRPPHSRRNKGGRIKHP
jgi:hypothetical protein